MHTLPLWELPQTGSIEMNGRTCVRKQVTIPVMLPLGYHEITVETGAHSPAATATAPPSSQATQAEQPGAKKK